MRISAIFQPFSYSCKPSFIEEFGENAYAKMKELVDKIIRALIGWAKRSCVVLSVWYECVIAYGDNGEPIPHIHGVLMASMAKARRQLDYYWQKYGLGFTGWRCPGHGGKPPSNAWWGRFENYKYGLNGWIGGGYWDKAKQRPNKGYLNSKANKYHTAMKHRSTSKKMGRLAIYDFYDVYQQGEREFYTFLNRFKC